MRVALVTVVKFHLTIACVLTAGLLPLAGATLERLSMDDLIAKSTGIVRGTVSESWSVLAGRGITTHYRVQVSERFKGGAQKVVEITVPGGTVGNLHQTSPGSPVLKTGESYVFFLWTSNAGVTWITGLTQGLFALGGEATDPTATRAGSRELMLDATTAQPVKDVSVTYKLSALRAYIAGRLGAGGAQ